MPARLPPLKTMPVFESAARHLSFTRAAEEMHVTQAAISHQIKALEEWLGVSLFRRFNRKLALTEAGTAYLPPVREALETLAAATESLSRGEAEGILTVSVLPSFTVDWLMPRLRRFQQDHPEIEVRIAANDGLADFTSDGVDLAIRYGRGVYPGLHSEWLLSESLFPVCSPRLMQNDQLPLREPGDLKHHALLQDYTQDDWRKWLMAAGVADVDPTGGLSFSHMNLVLQAAENGQGVAMARGTLAAAALAEGRLVRPFDFVLPVDFAYYVVCPEAEADRPKIKSFSQWLQREAALPE